MIRHMMAILWKQLKDTTSNKEILVQFLMFPVMTIVMEKAVKIDGMPAHYFANLFGVMYIAMAPITSMASIISEEKSTPQNNRIFPHYTAVKPKHTAVIPTYNTEMR